MTNALARQRLRVGPVGQGVIAATALNRRIRALCIAFCGRLAQRLGEGTAERAARLERWQPVEREAGNAGRFGDAEV